MFLKKKKKADEYSVVVYKKDLSVDLNRILFSGKSEGLKEYVYVPHFDASEEHYHIYLRFEKRVSEDVVDKLFFKTKCFICFLILSYNLLGVNTFCFFFER